MTERNANVAYSLVSDQDERTQYTVVILFIIHKNANNQTLGRQTRHPQRIEKLLKATSILHAPILQRFEVDTILKTVQGTLFNEHNDLLRRPPSPSVDAVWDRLASLGTFFISSSDVVRLGKNPEISTKAPLEWACDLEKPLTLKGFGPDAYLAHLDGQHALHCLDAVRRYAYGEYYYPDAKDWNTSSIDEAHRSHCLHILLQSLTCNYNFDLITYNVCRALSQLNSARQLKRILANNVKWMVTQKHPFPDFGVNKKCVNHDQILDWQAKNKISDEMWEDFAKRGLPEGQEIVPISPLMGLCSLIQNTSAQLPTPLVGFGTALVENAAVATTEVTVLLSPTHTQAFSSELQTSGCLVAGHLIQSITVILKHAGIESGSGSVAESVGIGAAEVTAMSRRRKKFASGSRPGMYSQEQDLVDMS
ncbi:hypothetical protein HYALB_00012260 [Hymenoscyphus albidus]|uniref:Uncharacterized protein n=1 Tax=Hymenoscyphus albidus TaxID=595503 RepID=A0A9N9Q907_9HELO|nr:hypothetical protein HYALB_00012260 [Hymenoscyphus albidus]